MTWLSDPLSAGHWSELNRREPLVDLDVTQPGGRGFAGVSLLGSLPGYGSFSLLGWLDMCEADSLVRTDPLTIVSKLDNGP